MKLDHYTIAVKMLDMGYPVNMQLGICAGITQMWAQACLCDEEENFFKHLRVICENDFLKKVYALKAKIKSLEPYMAQEKALMRNHVNAIRKKIAKLKEVLSQAGIETNEELKALEAELDEQIYIRDLEEDRLEKLLFSKDEREILEALILCDGIYLYNYPCKEQNFLGEFIDQYSVPALAEIIAAKKIKAQGGIVEIYSQPLIYDLEGLQLYFNDLTQLLEQINNPAKFVFCLGNHEHRMGLQYDLRTKKWILLNPSDPDAEHLSTTEVTPDKIAEEIMQALERKALSAFNINLFCTEKFVEPSYVHAFKEFKNRHEVTQKMAQQVTDQNISLAYIAAVNGHAEVIQKLAGFKVNFDQLVGSGTTLACIAAYAGNVDILSILIENNVNLNQPNDKGVTPIFVAAQNGHVAALKLLIANKADVDKPRLSGETPTYIATYMGQTKTLKLLLEHGANVNIPNSKGVTPVSIAVQKQQTEALKMLVEYGADLKKPNKHGETPVLIAVRKNDVKTLIILLEQKGVGLNKENKKGESPILIAIQNKNSEILQILAEHDADLGKTNKKGETLAFIATSKGDMASLKILGEHGVHLNKPNLDGKNPTRIAIQNDQVEIIKLLAKYHAIDIAHDKGDSPLSQTMQIKRWDIIVQLLCIDEKQNINKKEMKTLKNHRSILENALISHAESLNDDKEKRDLILDVIAGNNELGKILNMPSHSLGIFFTSKKYQGTKVTNSIYRIIKKFDYLLTADPQPANTKLLLL